MRWTVAFLALCVSLSNEIDPTYRDCANEVNRVVMSHASTNKVILPPESVKYPLPKTLTAQLLIVKLHGIDSTAQTLSTTSMFKLTWHDYRVAAINSGTFFGSLCSSSNYSHWNYVVEAVNRLPWYPQWVVSNGGKGVTLHGAWNYYPAKIKGDGTVDWWAMYHMNTECVLDVFYFPADFQQCKISISWPTIDYHTVQISVATPAVVTLDETSSTSSLWKLEGQSYELGDSSRPSVTFNLLLSRRSMFYIAAMMLPTLVINCMVVTGMILPPMSHKKVVSAFLNLTTVFLTSIGYYAFLPRTSDDTKSPVVMYFFACHNMFAVFAVAYVCFVYRVAEFRDKVEHRRKGLDIPADATPFEKAEAEIVAAGDRWVSGSFLGGWVNGTTSIDKINTIGAVIYGVLCIASYIVCLAFIYGLSTVKMGALVGTQYSPVDVQN